jgi:cytochrome oxidase Cu insertion factor (SCO1/SenC/PrrC family)
VNRPAAPPRAARTRCAAIAGSIGLALGLAPIDRGAMAAVNDADAVALRASQAAIGRSTGEHEFVDQHGRRLRLADLRGRPLALNLVYTSCYDVCSSLTLHLRDAVRIGRQTLGPQSFSVLTVGFDTAHDSPERMRIFARDRGVGDPDWHVVSADAATVRRLADEVGFTWVASPRGFDHVAQVSILDADGRVVHQVYGRAAQGAGARPRRRAPFGARPHRPREALLFGLRPCRGSLSIRLRDVCGRDPSVHGARHGCRRHRPGRPQETLSRIAGCGEHAPVAVTLHCKTRRIPINASH